MEPDSNQLARYLLGQLPTAEMHSISDRIFADEQFSKMVEDAEADILDAYVRGRLSEADRLAVEQRLLTSSAQMDKLRFAQALEKRLSPSAVPALSRSRRMWQAAAVGTIAAASLGMLLYRDEQLAQRNSQLTGDVARLRMQREAPRLGGAEISFLLSPELRSGGRQELKLPADADLVRLDFELPAPPARYRVTLQHAGGEMILDQRQILSRRIGEMTYVSVWLHAALLNGGAFEAAIASEEKPSTIRYSFDAVQASVAR